VAHPREVVRAVPSAPCARHVARYPAVPSASCGRHVGPGTRPSRQPPLVTHAPGSGLSLSTPRLARRRKVPQGRTPNPFHHTRPVRGVVRFHWSICRDYPCNRSSRTRHPAVHLASPADPTRPAHQASSATPITQGRRFVLGGAESALFAEKIRLTRDPSGAGEPAPLESHQTRGGCLRRGPGPWDEPACRPVPSFRRSHSHLWRRPEGCRSGRAAPVRGVRRRLGLGRVVSRRLGRVAPTTAQLLGAGVFVGGLEAGDFGVEVGQHGPDGGHPRAQLGGRQACRVLRQLVNCADDRGDRPTLDRTHARILAGAGDRTRRDHVNLSPGSEARLRGERRSRGKSIEGMTGTHAPGLLNIVFECGGDGGGIAGLRRVTRAEQPSLWITLATRDGSCGPIFFPHTGGLDRYCRSEAWPGLRRSGSHS
jgi:hypothetical protein